MYKFDGNTHALLATLDTAYAPMAISFGQDGNLNVLFDDYGPNKVLRYDLHTGALLGTLVAAGAGGLGRASSLLSIEPPMITLTHPAKAAAGAFAFAFSSVPGMSFTALAATNASAPANTWSNLGPVPEVYPGHFQFTEAPGAVRRFCRVRSRN